MKKSDPKIQGQLPAYWGGEITVRDYFAAMAMQGLLAANDVGAGDRINEIPEYAYWIADAMLIARKQCND